MGIKLVKLSNSMEIKLRDFLLESQDLPEVFKLIDNDFNKTVQEYENYSNGINLPKGFVPYTIFYAVDTNTNNIVGQMSVKHELNDYLKFRVGHIGCYVCPSQRKKGIGTKMLEQVIGFCKDINLDRILITCDESNIGSNKIILNNGGVLESKEIDSNGVEFNRYWLNI
ncbi:GNAT family N-acetyltransferase [Paeniclostridium sp. NSJ-45]|uniref:GNAT family N-acetyltransferase n=1 Tax=Paeniclostridium hominis TaxID=2764329 RepID=A0ABR7K0L0_9FIRM|nr:MULTISPECIES: GNAT family N-acetyltransferase [Paeniclostridium]MBC6002632.1 GNAT family N-acetyltransferase [Paeniclostridium hominis]